MRALPLLALCAAAAAAPALAQALANHNADAPVDFAADRIEVQDRADRVVLSGNVVVEQGGLTLNAARLTLAYSGTPGSGVEVERIDASGGVTVRSASETARGSFAIYDLNRRQITMLGGVTLTQGASRVSGGRLVIDLDTGRAVVDGSAVGAPGQPSSGGRVTGRFSVPERKND